MAENIYSGKTKSRRVFPLNQFIAGITRYDKGGDNTGNFAFSRGADVHSNPRELQILPASVKESGSVTQSLPQWGEHVFGDVFFLDGKGNIYQRNYSGSHTLIHTAPNSRGNGLAYYGEDFYLYFINNTTIGRYGPIVDSFVKYETWANGLDITKWNNWGSPQISTANKILTVTSTLGAGYYGVEQVSYDLTGKYISGQLLSVGSRSLTSWEVYPLYASINNSNQLFWYVDNANVLRAYKKVAGVNTILASGTYSPGTHRYFRIRESGGTCYFDYSSDYVTWVNFASTANPFAITRLFVGQYAGTYNTELSTTTAQFGLWSDGITPQTPQFVDDYFGSQGGVPTNTAQINLASASSQYLNHVDQAAYQITSDIAMEIYATPATLPTVGNSMTLMAKWNETGNKRAYKFDIYAISGFFGSGADGALTIASNTTDAPIDSACSGKSGDVGLSATNVSFAAGQKVLIIQMQGVGAGQQEVHTINGYTAGTITLDSPLTFSYAGVAQVIVIKQYTNVTVNVSCTWTAKAWNGATGGILIFLASGTFTNNGTISGDGKGFRGATIGVGGSAVGYQGEGTGGTVNLSQSTAANGNGGGGGGWSDNYPWNQGNGGGGGANSATNGTPGYITGGGNNVGGGGGSLGTVVSTPDLGVITLGGGGGSGGGGSGGGFGSTGIGGNGGAIIAPWASNWQNNGLITSNGTQGTTANYHAGGGGSGAGGSIWGKLQSGYVGNITASGGTRVFAGGHSTVAGDEDGGSGGDGRIAIAYLSSYTIGTATPTAVAGQDNSLVTSVTTQLRLGISDNGTNSEYLTINAAVPIGVAQRYGVSWRAATSQATFFVAGRSIGVSTGTKTAISNQTSDFTIGANNNGAAIANFYNGKLDDARLWNTQRTADQMVNNLTVQLVGNEYGLAAYYKFNSSPNDGTATANNLTPNAAPTYTTDPPYPASTTRQDIDQSYLQTATSTYAIPTAFTEADLQSFVPAKDPQKSIDIDINTVGTGDLTVVIHNGLNQEVARVTIPHAQLNTGFLEFIYANVFRPVIGATYHWHIYQSGTGGLVNTKTAADITTARFHTYYQFLVNDLFHPAMQVGNVLAIGNERYLAVQDAAAGYNNQRLRFPAGWHVRCITKWRNFYAIGCWKGSSITDFDQGIIFFWDGYSITYNDFIDVPQGGVNAMAGLGDKLYFVAGYQGKIMVYDGGTEPKQVRQIPKIDRTSTIEVLPGAMTVWQNMVRIGVALSSNNNNIQRGVYTLGHNFSDEPEAMTMDHVISTGNYDQNVQIGALIAANTNLLIGWGNNGAYGVDAVDPTGNPAKSATIEGNVNDLGVRWKDKLALVARADFKPLRAGESVKIKYRFGYDQAWISSGDNASIVQAVGDTKVRIPVAITNSGNPISANHHEFQIAVDMAQTNNTSPRILEFGMYEDLLTTEDENEY